MMREREKEREITLQILRSIRRYLQCFDMFQLSIKNIIESNY